ncbi:MAG TPA: alpha/beta fold hydrolase, partial [Gemmatimonadaceae bacterium]|nr:alpha/beta fold hydrolase [Gemmatimonadaceae bacterium]
MAQPQHKTISIDGVNIFYREAGPKGAPVLLLLHGFPSSSVQFRHMLFDLSDRFHMIAPDFPAFGSSDTPDPTAYAYTFDNLAVTVQHFLSQLDLTVDAIYLHDYG